MKDLNLIELTNLEKRYGKKEALTGINLTIGRGKIIGLLGPNGSGKTTLIKLLNGLLQPTSGEIKVNGKAPGVDSKKIISYLPDKMYFADWMKISDLMDFFEDFYEDFDRKKAEGMCETLKINTEAKIKNLSKGNKEKVRQNIIEVALDYLSCGIDPNKCTLFIQSMIPELTELTFYYLNLVTVARLQRNPTVKSEIQMREFENSLPAGFLCYPVSQAADITAFKGTIVPAGEDQEPMLEQTREIVRKFNSIYGDVLVEPEILLPQNCICNRLPGTDGKAKMSKSLGNCIYLSDDAATVWKKVKKMSNGEPRMSQDEPGHLEGNAVFTYMEAFSTNEDFAEFWPEFKTLDELKDQYVKGGIGDGTCKKFLNSVINKMLDPIRTRRHEWEQDIPEIFNILKKGSEAARETAAKTMDEVRAAMQINYFDDKDAMVKSWESWLNESHTKN